MIEMPAQVLRNKSSQSAHHCQVLSASLSVKSWPARCEVWLAVGVQPSGVQPSGGLFMQNPPEGWKPDGWTPTASHTSHRAGHDFTLREAFKNWQRRARCRLLSLH